MKSMNWRLPPVVRRSLAGKQVPVNASPAPLILVNAGWCLNANVTNVRPIRVRTMLNVWPGSAKKRTDVLCLSVPPLGVLLWNPRLFDPARWPANFQKWNARNMELAGDGPEMYRKKKYKMANPRNDKVPGIVPRLFNQNDVRNAVFYSFPMSPCFSQSQSAQTPIEASAWRRSRKRTTHAPETEKVFGDLGFKHLCLVLKLYGISKSTYPMMNLK